MAVITERASACSSFRTLHARAHVGDTQEGGRPYVLTGSQPRKSPGAPPVLRPAAASAHVAKATFSLLSDSPSCGRLDCNHSHVLRPELLPSEVSAGRT